MTRSALLGQRVARLRGNNPKMDRDHLVLIDADQAKTRLLIARDRLYEGEWAREDLRQQVEAAIQAVERFSWLVEHPDDPA